MPILMFMNLKGGVAKTTNAVAVAECLAAEHEQRVLVIDADHQCAASEILLGEDRYLHCDNRKATLHDLMADMLKDDFDAEQVAGVIEDGASDIDGGLENLSVIPCSMRIDDFHTNRAKSGAGFQTNEEYQRVYRSRRRAICGWLNKNYDCTIIDCPPTVALQVRTFLPMASSYIVPCVPDRLSVRGATLLVDRLRRLNIKTPCMGTLWSLHRQNNTVHTQTIEDSRKKVGLCENLPLPFKTIIPNATAIARATEYTGRWKLFKGRKPRSFKAKYGTASARAFRSLCQEITERCAKLEA